MRLFSGRRKWLLFVKRSFLESCDKLWIFVTFAILLFFSSFSLFNSIFYFFFKRWPDRYESGFKATANWTFFTFYMELNWCKSRTVCWRVWLRCILWYVSVTLLVKEIKWRPNLMQIKIKILRMIAKFMSLVWRVQRVQYRQVKPHLGNSLVA